MNLMKIKRVKENICVSKLLASFLTLSFMISISLPAAYAVENKNISTKVAVATTTTAAAKTTTPAKPTVTANKKGNTMSNLNSGGRLAKDGEWLYYVHEGI